MAALKVSAQLHQRAQRPSQIVVAWPLVGEPAPCRDALDEREPRSLGTVARKMLDSLVGYEIGFHLHASVQAHLSKHCRDGAAREYGFTEAAE